MSPIGSVGKASALQRLPYESYVTIDDFERGDLTPYTHTYGASTYEVNTNAPVMEGNYSAKQLSTSTTDWNLLISTSGLNYHPTEGDVISGYLNETDTDTQVMYGWYGNDGNSGDGYSVMLDFGDNTVEMRRWDNASSTLLDSAAVTIEANKWYDVETSLEGGGVFTSNVYAVDSNGKRTDPSTSLATVSATDTTHPSSNGVIIGNRGSTGAGCAIDHLRKVGEV